MINIGFTGTQEGMTQNQKLKFRELIQEYTAQYDEIVFHHGDCLGADAESHQIVRELKPEAMIIIHPPIRDSKRAFCRGTSYRLPKPYLDRNHDIVDDSLVLIAAPKSFKEELRSGTWATVRYARKHEKQVYLLQP